MEALSTTIHSQLNRLRQHYNAFDLQGLCYNRLCVSVVCECCVQESNKHEWATPPIVPSVRWGIKRTDLTLGDVRKWFGVCLTYRWKPQTRQTMKDVVDYVVYIRTSHRLSKYSHGLMQANSVHPHRPSKEGREVLESIRASENAKKGPAAELQLLPTSGC